jgi:hypothetical protein
VKSWPFVGRWKQQAVHYADWGLSFGNPDFVAYAAYGAGGSQVTTADGLTGAVVAAFLRLRLETMADKVGKATHLAPAPR